MSGRRLAKGLEFRAVAVMACDDEVVPLLERIETVADETELEDVMVGFANGDADILVCTTIIESGLDMPNVNTITMLQVDQTSLSMEEWS